MNVRPRRRPRRAPRAAARAKPSLLLMSGSPKGPFRGQGSPLFQEWLGLTADAELAPASHTPIGSDDALLIIDMQADFVPCHIKSNPFGGRFGVEEGDHCVAPIVDLISAASAVGATIVATRDYHPHDHVSFISQGGMFPTHCVQGSKGAELLPAIAEALIEAWRRAPDEVMIAFKAFHEDVDSFGGFPYFKNGEGRVARREPGAMGWASSKCPMGCNAFPFTGCVVAKQSALEELKAAGPEAAVAADMNAPPDMLALYDEAGRERGKRSLQARRDRVEIAASIGSRRGLLMTAGAFLQAALQGKKRLFVCGLALDFCVTDTCLNAKDAGFDSVHLLLDAARAAHIAGVGTHGTGFVSSPPEVPRQV
jgi:nicotinamidase-related amidase